MLVILFFAQPVFAQEKRQAKLPDYSKWEMESSGGPVLYRGVWGQGLVDYRSDRVHDQAVRVYYKPIEQKKFEELLDKIGEEKLLESLRKNPLIALYSYNTEASGETPIYVFEHKRSPWKFYRLWRPRWKLVYVFNNEEVFNNTFPAWLKNRYGFIDD
ncbi:MAG: hypothetical protein Q8R55_07465, partial [Candidatus Taylorbacteria bacterium]|nr:hypothetical protein [Candidatus Taylorbacteria bacterium]